MKRILKTIFLIVFCMPALSVSAQEIDSLGLYIESNPNAVDYNIISEGSKMYLSANDKYLLVYLSIANPTLQMRFLMQRATLYIDPSGKKRKNYKLVLPAAPDVKDQLAMSSNMGQEDAGSLELAGRGQGPDAKSQGSRAKNKRPSTPNQGHGSRDMDQEGGERPDIRLLVRALNYWGADYYAGDDAQHISNQYFHMEHSPEENLLCYYILIPKEQLMRDKRLNDTWSIGISLVNDMQRTPPQPGMGGGPEGMTPPPPGGGQGGGMPGGRGGERGGQKSMQKVMQSDINVWTKFSIDDVNNAN